MNLRFSLWTFQGHELDFRRNLADVERSKDSSPRADCAMGRELKFFFAVYLRALLWPLRLNKACSSVIATSCSFHLFCFNPHTCDGDIAFAMKISTHKLAKSISCCVQKRHFGSCNDDVHTENRRRIGEEFGRNKFQMLVAHTTRCSPPSLPPKSMKIDRREFINVHGMCDVQRRQ